MPVDPCAAAEAVERILAKGFPIAADSHGHIDADWGEHTAKHIREEFYHGKAFFLIRSAHVQELAHLKAANEPPHRIICLLRFHQLL